MSAINTNPNAAAGISMQVCCTLLWGETGVGKTSSIRSLMQSLNRVFIHMNGATNVAEDFSGYPCPDFEAGIVRQLPPSWVKRLEHGDGAILCDELTCTSQATLAGELTLLSDNIVGDYELPDTTLKVAAANPPELAPNSAPLPASIRSRFVHFDWVIDREALLAGYRNGCEWEAPAWPIVPETWEENMPYFGSLVEAFLRSHPDALCRMPTDDTVRAFPNPRGYEFLIRTLAAAKACGYGDMSDVSQTLARGCVGEPEAASFMRFVRTMDLIDPAAILDGSAEYEPTSRADLNICLVTGLIQQLRVRTDAERWTRAADVFATMAESGEIETVLLGFKSLWNDTKHGGVRPVDLFPSLELQNRLNSAI
jgi:hypothetical protein